MNWQGSRVLVTGDMGFIGSHVRERLQAVGAITTGIDIKGRQDLRRMSLNLEGYSHVFHFAANMGGIGFISTVGAEIMHDNLLMNLRMLDAARSADLERFFFSSSACIYPRHLQTKPDIEGLREEDAMPADPDSYYGWEKLATEQMCQAYMEDYGLPVRIARYHNIYGPGNTYTERRGKVISSLCRKAIRYPEEPFVIWGDGQQTRSFTYIDDCVDATLMLMESDVSEPLNIGTDRLVTIEAVADMIISISGKEIVKQHDPSKPQGVRGRNADLTKIRKLLGWEPKVSLEDGVQRTYEWLLGRFKTPEVVAGLSK